VDGDLDVAIIKESDSLAIFPGGGDGTFGAPVPYVTDLWPDGIVAADLNNDGKPDIAVGTRYGQAVNVFINGGGLLFAQSSIPLSTPVAGITAWDLDGDGNRELIAGGVNEDNPWSDQGQDGVVYVMRGNGTGTFAPAVTYPTGNDPRFVVAGDFNRDGRADVATGNLSDWYDGMCDGFAFMPHSVSILPGNGLGTLAAPSTFTLGSYPDFEQESHIQSLKTTDLNGDGRTDLVASGKLLFNAAPVANRVPVANAGPDREGTLSIDFMLSGTASDPDQHYLRFEWRDEEGNVVGDEARSCVRESYTGAQTFTLTVDDGLGGVDTDTVTVAFGSATEPHGSIDVGGVSSPGSTTMDGSGWTLTGSGADIWGRADEFHYQAHLERGDFDAVARVASVQNVHPWTKAGIMIRESFDAGSRHAFVFATPTSVKGVGFQRRPVTNGDSVHTSGPATAPPAWLMLSRRGDRITVYYSSSESHPWTLIGEQVLTGLPRDVLIGLALTSHVDGVTATAVFENYMVTQPPFQSADIGSVGVAGTTATSDRTIMIEGGGADIWGTADAFRYHYRKISGDAFVQVDVESIEATHAWSKAGLMFRETLSPGSKHVMAIVSAGKGVAMQYRPATNGVSVQAIQLPATAPRRLVMRRQGDEFAAWSYPTDGGAGVFLGSVTVPMGAEIYVGVPVTAHNNATLATAVVRDLSVGQF
jgi:hypothetical protein